MTDSLHLRYPLFPDQVEPKGRLLIDKRCHAAWYYYALASKSRQAAGTGPESQIITIDPGEPTPEWMERRYDQIARTVAMLYGLDSPDDFIPYFEQVILEANRLGYPVYLDLLSPFGVGT